MLLEMATSVEHTEPRQALREKQGWSTTARLWGIKPPGTTITAHSMLTG